MYKFKIRTVLTIDYREADSKDSRSKLQRDVDLLLSLFRPFGVHLDGTTPQYQQYYIDEEAEMKCRPSVAVSIELHGACSSFRSTIFLTQIVQTVAAWLDGVNGRSVRCQILSPYYINGDDEFEVP